MLLISILLGLIPLAGIAWIIVTGTITTVDGLFECLIMLSISGVFFLNAFWELRDRGLLGKSNGEASCVAASQNVPAQSRAVFPHRLVDRPHAVLVLVEHLVWTPAHR